MLDSSNRRLPRAKSVIPFPISHIGSCHDAAKGERSKASFDAGYHSTSRLVCLIEGHLSCLGRIGCLLVPDEVPRSRYCNSVVRAPLPCRNDNRCVLGVWTEGGESTNGRDFIGGGCNWFRQDCRRISSHSSLEEANERNLSEHDIHSLHCLPSSCGLHQQGVWID